jgi:uncharacterized protein
MQVSISGSSGFIGSSIKKYFLDKGWVINEIDRATLAMQVNDLLFKKIEGSDLIINLAGAPVQKRWSESYKQEILQSRVVTTRRIVEAIHHSTKKNIVFISGSAIGIYDSDHNHDEESTFFSHDFLGQVCTGWENEAMKANDITRLIRLRIGIVLGTEGGMLHKVHPFFKTGLGGKIGDGRQILSWIHIDDLVRTIAFIVENESLSGIINAVSPGPVNNEYFTKTFGKVLVQPTFFKVPLFGLKAIYGEAAQMLVTGQTVIPQKLMNNGFEFKFPTIEKALVNLYRW